MKTDQFYVTLPSNSSMSYYPANTVANYITHLPRAIHLPPGEGGGNGQWEVALVELHYPCSFFTVNEDSMITFYHYKPGHVDDNEQDLELKYVKLKPGDYPDVKSVIDVINRNRELNSYMRFKYDDKAKMVELFPQSYVKQVELSHTLALQLGYDPYETDMKKNKKAIRPAELRLGLPSAIYVYCDLVEPQYIGDTVAPLLRIVNVDTTDYVYGSSRVITYNSPHYVPVMKGAFENVEIDLRDSTGRALPFQFGTSCVKLHFRYRAGGSSEEK